MENPYCGCELTRVRPALQYISIWTKENETAWKLSRPRESDTVMFKDVKDIFVNLYGEGSNPIEEEDQPGEDFAGYWLALVMVPGVFPSAEEKGEDAWHRYVAYARMAEADKADEEEGRTEIACDDIKKAIQTFRFRDNFKKVQDELDFHGLAYENDSSTLQYDHVLRAFVQNRMGANALTLEEQMARNPDQFGIAEDAEQDEEDEEGGETDDGGAEGVDDDDEEKD